MKLLDDKVFSKILFNPHLVSDAEFEQILNDLAAEVEAENHLDHSVDYRAAVALDEKDAVEMSGSVLDSK